MRFLAYLSALLFTSFLWGEEPLPLQDWIDEAIQAGGGVVTIPEGVHEVPVGLRVSNAEKLALRGMDKEGCVLKLAAGASEQALITLTGGKTLEIAGLTLVGNGSDAALIQIEAAEGKPLQDLHLRDCLFQTFKVAVTAVNAQTLHVERCSFRDGQQAMALTAVNKGILRGNQFIRLETALHLHHCPALLAEGNEIRSSSHGIQVKTQAGDEPVVLRNNGFIEVDDPLKTDPPGQGVILEANDGISKS